MPARKTEPMPDDQSPPLFADVRFDPDRYGRRLRTPLPATRYGIFFTPRSGSSWLTEVATRSGVLGNPGEFFNPGHIPKIARGLGADTLERYCALLQRARSPGGVFGFEITWFQLERVFGSEEAFLRAFPARLPYIYLTRRNIVLQAVSLAKAVTTEVFHAPQASAADLARADLDFAYDAALIADWLAHIREMERRSERFFARAGIVPVRLCYEQITRWGPSRTVRRLAAVAGVKAPADLPLADLAHRKIGTAKNARFARRFRSEFPELCAETEAGRADPTGRPAPARRGQS
jgi:LPS sulfotransferase NodH